MSNPQNAAQRARLVVADANVVINLIHTELLCAIAALPRLTFAVTDEVYDEVCRPAQRAELDRAIQAGHWRCCALTQPKEIALYAELRTLMQRGEAASLAYAACNDGLVACDERRAFRREAEARLGPRRMVDTPGLLLLSLRAGLLTVEQADQAKAHLERNRFRMRFTSFAQLIKGAG